MTPWKERERLFRRLRKSVRRRRSHPAQQRVPTAVGKEADHLAVGDPRDDVAELVQQLFNAQLRVVRQKAENGGHLVRERRLGARAVSQEEAARRHVVRRGCEDQRGGHVLRLCPTTARTIDARSRLQQLLQNCAREANAGDFPAEKNATI